MSYWHPLVWAIINMQCGSSNLFKGQDGRWLCTRETQHWVVAHVVAPSGGTKWWHKLGGGVRNDTVTGWVVAQEFLSPWLVMAHCQVLGVAAKWLGTGGVCVLGSGPEAFYLVYENLKKFRPSYLEWISSTSVLLKISSNSTVEE